MKLSKIALIGLSTLALGTSLQAFDAGVYDCDKYKKITGGLTYILGESGEVQSLVPGVEFTRTSGIWINTGKKAFIIIDNKEKVLSSENGKITIQNIEGYANIQECEKLTPTTPTAQTTPTESKDDKIAQLEKELKIAKDKLAKPSVGYYVQVAAYTNEPNQLLLDQINNLDFKYKLMNNKVLIGPFDSEAVTRDVLTRVKEIIAPDAFFKIVK